MIVNLRDEITGKLARGERVWLFLDYDGTLADFAPTPEDIIPDEELIHLLSRLVQIPNLRVAIISGRRLKHIRELVPISGILLAGTYGIEVRLDDQGDTNLEDYAAIRPVLEALKPQWEALMAGRTGFFLEDKGWALAIHAKHAEDSEAEQLLSQARELLAKNGFPKELRLLGGHKFLEIGPKTANKGNTIAYLLERLTRPGALLVYIGDDDKDEEAFAVIKEQGGRAVVVSREPRPTLADYRLESPQNVRQLLESLASDACV